MNTSPINFTFPNSKYIGDVIEAFFSAWKPDFINIEFLFLLDNVEVLKNITAWRGVILFFNK